MSEKTLHNYIMVIIILIALINCLNGQLYLKRCCNFFLKSPKMKNCLVMKYVHTIISNSYVLKYFFSQIIKNNGKPNIDFKITAENVDMSSGYDNPGKYFIHPTLLPKIFWLYNFFFFQSLITFYEFQMFLCWLSSQYTSGPLLNWKSWD